MKNLFILFAFVLSFMSLNASAHFTKDSKDQRIEALQQEVNALRQILLQSQAEAKPACLTTGERCSSQYDFCCDGRYCGISMICR